MVDDQSPVRTDVTVSPEPEHSVLAGQKKSDLYADPVPTGDPVTLEAQGIEVA